VDPMIAGWPEMRRRWWLWLTMGLSGGLAAALWLHTVYPAINNLSANPKTQTAVDAQSRISALEKSLNDTTQSYRMRLSGYAMLGLADEFQNNANLKNATVYLLVTPQPGPPSFISTYIRDILKSSLPNIML